MRLPTRVVIRLGVKAVSFNHCWAISKHGDTPSELRGPEDRIEFISRDDGSDVHDVELKMTRCESDFVGHGNHHSPVWAVVTNPLVGRPRAVIVPDHAFELLKLKGFRVGTSWGWYYEDEELTCRIDRHEDSNGMKQWTIWVGIENYHPLETLVDLPTLQV